MTSGASVGSLAPEMAGGKAKWEESAEKREASLRERKAQMILAARESVVFLFSLFLLLDVDMRFSDLRCVLCRRLLAQQRAEAQASSSA